MIWWNCSIFTPQWQLHCWRVSRCDVSHLLRFLRLHCIHLPWQTPLASLAVVISASAFLLAHCFCESSIRPLTLQSYLPTPPHPPKPLSLTPHFLFLLPLFFLFFGGGGGLQLISGPSSPVGTSEQYSFKAAGSLGALQRFTLKREKGGTMRVREEWGGKHSRKIKKIKNRKKNSSERSMKIMWTVKSGRSSQ